MKLFLIKQNKNSGYDTYDLAVVVALDERAARYIHPGAPLGPDGRDARWWEDRKLWIMRRWTGPEYVKATYLGEAKANTPQGVICASYNAG